MSAPRVLFVKLSSLGDVIHNLPALTDLAERHPGAIVDWAVEEAYAGLVRLHPALAHAIPVALRRLRASPVSGAAWRALGASRRALGARPYDFVVDTQGLAKSALVAGFARGPSFGFDRRSAREPLASRFYDVAIAVPRGLHAVERNRRLVAEVFGYRLETPADYGIRRPDSPPAWAPTNAYAVLLHAASRADKRWPEARWVELGGRLAALGLRLVLPGGNEAEREGAARLARAIPGALAAPPMELTEAAALLGHAAAVAGVDTGLTHLAAALGRPTVGLYCATDPALTGLHGGVRSVNLGAAGAPPSVGEVYAALAAGDGG